ncbi:MAG: hypothetical protein F4W90_01360 [Gammaproteobacteria bacterium]|nr:hypothetical protein [Gammaproteobacteria bacterium]
MTKTKKIVLAGLSGSLVLAVILGAFIFRFYDVEHEVTHHDDHTHTLATKSKPANPATLPQDLPARKTQVAWTTLTNQSLRNEDRWSHVPEHAVFVNLNRQFEQWLLSTPVTIEVPHIDASFEALIERIERNSPKSTTIYGIPSENEEELHRLIVTFSENRTLAYISSARGSWELVGDREIGWIVATIDLKKSQDYSETDVRGKRVDRYANAEYVPKLKQ